MQELLQELFHRDIQLVVNDQNIKMIYQKENINTQIKNNIKDQKKELIKRLKENEIALEHNWIVHGQGELYEYRYGFASYIFIERLPNDKVIAWRANYRKDEMKPYKVKIIGKNIEFETAMEGQVGLLNGSRSRVEGGEGMKEERGCSSSFFVPSRPLGLLEIS